MEFIVLEKGANPDYLPYKEKYNCQSCVWKHHEMVLIKGRAIQLFITLLLNFNLTEKESNIKCWKYALIIQNKTFT